jgi:hypothetical protein
MIPMVGSVATEVFSSFIETPLSRRRQVWMESVAEVLRDLSLNRGFSLEDLRDNDAFVDTVLQATHAASRTSQAEKLRALRNAIFNAVLPGSPDEEMQRYFLGLVDELSPWHLRILNLFDHPQRWFQENSKSWPSNVISGGLDTVLKAAYPQLADKRDLYDLIVKELHDRSLMSVGSLHGMMSSSGFEASRTTGIGKQFIAFLSEPKI